MYLDGHDLRYLDPSWVRGHVLGYINQEPVLFAASIMENIRYGNPSCSDDEVGGVSNVTMHGMCVCMSPMQVIEAAKLANAHNFISEFPQGYTTVVGERGVTLSGGQKQR